MISIPTFFTFLIYFSLLLGTGIFFYKRTQNIGDYILGGRGLGKWITAFSAQASDMSGWLLMGLPGAIYFDGIPAVLIAIGLFVGTLFNWKLISQRLRIYSAKTDSLTLSSFFEDRFRDPTGLLRIISAIITLIFFTIYASSGFVAAGKLFESIFHIDYRVAASIGAFIIVLYTFLGGFLAVSWTDFFQGLLMVIAIIIVSAVAYNSVDGFNGIRRAMISEGQSVNIIPGSNFSLLTTISTLAWGLGYFGQPHILARFMSIKSSKELPQSMKIAIIWVFISLTGAVFIGFLSIPMFQGLSGGDQEKVFIYMINCMFNPWIGGIMLAAILSAIMSTIDSQLLVCSSALTEDFYEKIIKKDATQRELVFIGRLCVVVISLIALSLALNPNYTILRLVAYAWGGFGAAFGPLILYALFSKRTTWLSALSGMIIGTITLILWKEIGLGEKLYEIVPGFFANALTIYLINHISPAKDREIIQEFIDVEASLRGRAEDR
ncbi:MAG: sodium/proline symporter PutP [Spirochaetota bacterium]|nr:sodium/proline symporter PutP [Spirochaetota bacterium]